MEKKPRKPVFDKDKQREVCAIVAVGCSRAVAAQYVGCDIRAIRRRVLVDPDFADAIERAESHHEIMNLKNINEAGKVERHWRAAAWALEHAYPDRYGKRRARTLTFEQVAGILSQFADAIVEDVPDPAARERIVERLGALAAEFESAAAKGGGK
jgi:hypothetical protein